MKRGIAQIALKTCVPAKSGRFSLYPSFLCCNAGVTVEIPSSRWHHACKTSHNGDDRTVYMRAFYFDKISGKALVNRKKKRL